MLHKEQTCFNGYNDPITSSFPKAVENFKYVYRVSQLFENIFTYTCISVCLEGLMKSQCDTTCPFSGPVSPPRKSKTKWLRRARYCRKERQGGLISHSMLQSRSQVTFSYTSKFFHVFFPLPETFFSLFSWAHIRSNFHGETFPNPPWWIFF